MPTIPFLHSRQSGSNSFATVPSSYGSANSSPHPGVVAGIVIGSVGGFLLLLFLIYSCLGFGPSVWVQPSRSEYTAASQSVLSFRTRRSAAPSHVRSTRRQSRGPRVTETYEVRTRESRGPPPRRAGSRMPPPGEPVIIESTRVPPPPRVVRSEDSEDDDDDEDEIVVLEEHSRSPPRKNRRRRSSERRRSEERYSRGGGSYYHDAEPGSPYRERRDRRYSRDR